MGIQKVEEGGISRNFYHPYMQAFTMVLGELFCLAIYYSDLQKYKKPLEEGKTKHNFLHFLVPGVINISLSVMQYIALNFISGSTFKLLQGGSIITTAIFSKILINMVLKSYHLIGCLLTVIGVTIVGMSDIVFGTHSNDKAVELQIIGITCLIISMVLQGYNYSYEQRLMQRHSIHFF
jgi:drug/metabolite transporter (DMT)-like permease